MTLKEKTGLKETDQPPRVDIFYKVWILANILLLFLAPLHDQEMTVGYNNVKEFAPN